MSATDVVALALAALMAGAGALLLVAARFRRCAGRARGIRRLSGATLTVVSLALLVGAQQAAARALGWSVQLPAALVAVVIVLLVAAAIYLDVHLAGDDEDSRA